MKYRIKDWSKFQHFKDRKPPWIKLYRDLLDDLEWHELDPVAAKSLVMIWLIASENEGYLPDMKKLAFRLRLTEKLTKSIVSNLGHWLEQCDIDVISERYQSDPLERETETEEETETEKTTAQAPPVFVLPEWVNRGHWETWHQCPKRRKATDAQKRLTLEKLDEWRTAGLDHATALQNAAIGGNQGIFLPNTPQARASPAESNYTRQQREKWETVTGRNRPTRPINEILELPQ